MYHRQSALASLQTCAGQPLQEGSRPSLWWLLCRQARKVFGLPLGTPEASPVSVDRLPASEQELTPSHEWTVWLPEGATVFGDKAYGSDPDAFTLFAATGVRFVAIPRATMTPNSWADDYDLRHFRRRIESV
jgi:hypothetical protein